MKLGNTDLLNGLPQDADSILAQELSAMSVKERERVYFDIHGVSEIVTEEPAFVESCLTGLEKELQCISLKRAYNDALSQNAEYVTNRKFRLKFLRAEGFNPKLAASRLLQFLERKSKLFGVEKLARDIKLSDLDSEDRLCIDSGICQLLPLRDRAGRSIITWMPVLLAGKNITNMVSAVRFGSSEDNIYFVYFGSVTLICVSVSLFCFHVSTDAMLILLHACRIRGRGDSKERYCRRCN
jgi:hypothetical protein